MIIDFKGIKPKIGEEVFITYSACVVGDVEIGNGCSLWFNSVVRGDSNPIVIGDKTNIQEDVVLHGDDDILIGSYVTLGHKCLIHGAKIGNNTLIGMGAIILDNAVISENSIVAAGSVVTPGKKFPPGVLLMGTPARVVRELTYEEIQGNKNSALHYIELTKGYKKRVMNV